ncbi:prepilin peptidase [Sodalis-like symbiont of Bactericera trigonica]|nr:prepilin peptidase [Sodalis-like symbiont of Bactericera trigonica]
MLWLPLRITVGLALHVALLHLLANLPLASHPSPAQRWPFNASLPAVAVRWCTVSAGRSLFAPGAALAGAIMLLSALLMLAVVDAVTLRLTDIITQPLLWLGLLFNLGATFVPLSDAVWGAVAGYLSLWCINGVYRLARRRHGIGAWDFKLLAALGAWLGWRGLPLLLLLAATGGVFCILCLRRWRDACDAAGVWSLARCCFAARVNVIATAVNCPVSSRRYRA